MTSSIMQLASDVAAILGETLALDCHPEESPFPDLEARVRLLAPECLKRLLLDTPKSQLENVRPLSGTVSVDKNGVGRLLLPDDFLQLVHIRMSDWERSVNSVTEFECEAFSQQRSSWTGIRGNRWKPVVTLDFDSVGQRCLLLYSCTKGAVLNSAGYIALPKISAQDTLEIPDTLYHPLVLKIAEMIKES